MIFFGSVVANRSDGLYGLCQVVFALLIFRLVHFVPMLNIGRHVRHIVRSTIVVVRGRLALTRGPPNMGS
jgi:hypothetical protein